jgi:hypothetical protein
MTPSHTSTDSELPLEDSVLGIFSPSPVSLGFLRGHQLCDPVSRDPIEGNEGVHMFMLDPKPVIRSETVIIHEVLMEAISDPKNATEWTGLVRGLRAKTTEGVEVLTYCYLVTY